jgi:hypothetical protein
MNDINRPIWLIEDDPTEVDLAKRAFASLHLINPIRVFSDGEQAIEMIASWTPKEPLPAIVLLDLNLPKLDGLEVLRILKTHPELMVAPVIVLSSSSQDSDIQSAYMRGANSYILKPLDFEGFIEVADLIDQYWNVINTPLK